MGAVGEREEKGRKVRGVRKKGEGKKEKIFPPKNIY
jgi:hypothetical protein